MRDVIVHRSAPTGGHHGCSFFVVLCHIPDGLLSGDKGKRVRFLAGNAKFGSEICLKYGGGVVLYLREAKRHRHGTFQSIGQR